MTNQLVITTLVAGLLALGFPGSAAAGDGDPSAVKKTSTLAERPATPQSPSKLVPSGGISDKEPDSIITVGGKPVFVPPNRGTPVARVGGAARAMTVLPGIEALVPLESGLTLEEYPVVYWYLTESTDLPVNFTLIDLNEENPIVDLTIEGPFNRGVQRVRLEDHGASLSQGNLYQWFVALVPDPEDRSSDRLAGGGIERVDSKVWLDMRLQSADPEQVPGILAGAGLWYDALDLLNERIDAAPSDPGPTSQRAALFEQVGLEAVLRTQ